MCLKHLFAISLCNKRLLNIYYVPDNVGSTEDTDTMKDFEKLIAEEKGISHPWKEKLSTQEIKVSRMIVVAEKLY